MVDPVGPNHQVWHINYQDVSAIGTLITTGILDVERFISFGGPVVSKPRLLSTRLGANIGELTANELTGDDNRINFRQRPVRSSNNTQHGLLGTVSQSNIRLG